MRIIFVLLVLLLATPARAQQQTPTEQALGAKLMQELQGGLNCNTSLISVRNDLVKAQARIEELEKAAKEKEGKPDAEK